MDYRWDEDKARINLNKHDIDFADAVGVFEDPLALTLEDTESSEESRRITLGTDLLRRLLMVVYTYRRESIRIISARKATSKERDSYEGKRKGI